MCVKKRRDLECRPESVALGRRFVADTLAEWGVDTSATGPELVDDALLVTSELLTNGIKVCEEAITVELAGNHDHLEISVSDDSPRPASLVDRGAASESGRGMQIISTLCPEWGQTEHDGARKRVWCRLPLRSR